MCTRISLWLPDCRAWGIGKYSWSPTEVAFDTGLVTGSLLIADKTGVLTHSISLVGVTATAPPAEPVRLITDSHPSPRSVPESELDSGSIFIGFTSSSLALDGIDIGTGDTRSSLSTASLVTAASSSVVLAPAFSSSSVQFSSSPAATARNKQISGGVSGAGGRRAAAADKRKKKLESSCYGLSELTYSSSVDGQETNEATHEVVRSNVNNNRSLTTPLPINPARYCMELARTSCTQFSGLQEVYGSW